ncbi:hypothetical protein PUR71_07035 [Streptomyces sp. SP17BM10]|nr:hypothetical protein [Streptomyces sp. SP17BM10]MEE1782677.1 hypothetical protein [Streptomyces sp. SP17BM10]
MTAIRATDAQTLAAVNGIGDRETSTAFYQYTSPSSFSMGRETVPP